MIKNYYLLCSAANGGKSRENNFHLTNIIRDKIIPETIIGGEEEPQPVVATPQRFMILYY